MRDGPSAESGQRAMKSTTLEGAAGGSPVVKCDVAIVGGGPAGSTAAALLRKYNPSLRVVVLEREEFPREHVGESQLPAIGAVLDEMGVWDKVEAANFPIKLGASLTWGRDQESWDLDFYPVEKFQDEPRPAKYVGQRTRTAFQVNRAVYDKILLEHAREGGAEILQPAAVREVMREGDRVTGLMLDDGRRVESRHYVDASGTAALFRRAFGLGIEAPRELRNVAFWDYWENAEWAVQIGVGGTRIQVRSLPYGWLWFIPLGPTTTSLGLVCPAQWHQQAGRSIEEVYYDAVRSEPSIAELTRHATPSGHVRGTKDWSLLTERLTGENWMLVGEAAGFADPILSAGMTLAHTSAREAAYVILEIERGAHDSRWLKKWYNDKNRLNIRQHIRFAQFWYASNGCFTELKENCRQIAREAGLSLSPAEAWRWLAQGGFARQGTSLARFGSFDVTSARALTARFSGSSTTFEFMKHSTFKLNLLGATRDHVAHPADGRIERIECYRRGERTLPNSGTFANVTGVLKKAREASKVLEMMLGNINASVAPEGRSASLREHLATLEAMIADGWVIAKDDPKHARMNVDIVGTGMLRSTAEGMEALKSRR